MDRKTARRYVEAAVAAGLVREGGEEQLTDELIGAVVAAVRPARPAGHGAAWEALLAERGADPRLGRATELQLTKIHGKLARQRGRGAVPDVAPVRGRSGAGSAAGDDGAGRRR